MRNLSRNPFARHTVIRETVKKHERKECKNCNQQGKYRYGVDPDSGSKHFLQGTFCSKSCCESYHNTKLE